MPKMNGLDAARQILSELPQTRIIFLTTHNDLACLVEALRTGASGYLLKNATVPELSEAIRAVVAGGIYISPGMEDRLILNKRTQTATSAELTPRQRNVLRLIAEGLSAKEIGPLLKISSKTVEYHRSAILQKLGLRNTADLIRYSIKHEGSSFR